MEIGFGRSKSDYFLLARPADELMLRRHVEHFIRDLVLGCVGNHGQLSDARGIRLPSVMMNAAF